MVAGVAALLDDQHAQIVEAIWQEFTQRIGVHGLSQTPIPHLTYHVAASYDTRIAVPQLRQIASQTPPFMIQTNGLGLFTGPEPFMQDIRDLLRDAGFDMAHYHQESFGEPPKEAPTEPVVFTPDGVDGVEGTGVTAVSFTMSGVEGECLPGQTVLQAARAAGVRIPAACESGLCGTCKILKLSGEVEINHNGGILDEEIEEGYILACCSRPLGKLEVEA